ncbi:MAG TPA: hypothetical protein VH170_03330 [Chthoniobacterales bacterium]|jgi:hypothetical protein|nr:hypothetical protein [Chthoniobacterales bacterium]
MALICLSAIFAYTTDAGAQTPPANAAPPAQLQAATPPPRPVQIDRNSAYILIRSTLLALHHANQTGNYSVFYALSAPAFQKDNSPERLSKIFQSLREKHFDLSGVLVLEPQLTVLPEIYSNNVMRMAGFFPSVPMQVYFELQFAPVEGQWRVVALAVNVGGSSPPAPTPNPALASSQPAPAAPSATVSPSPTGTPSPPTVEIRPAAKVTPTPTPRRGSRQSLGRP